MKNLLNQKILLRKKSNIDYSAPHNRQMLFRMRLLKFYKQIGFLDLSGSFSSIDDFYNGNINNLKIKFN